MVEYVDKYFLRIRYMLESVLADHSVEQPDCVFREKNIRKIDGGLARAVKPLLLDVDTKHVACTALRKGYRLASVAAAQVHNALANNPFLKLRKGSAQPM